MSAELARTRRVLAATNEQDGRRADRDAAGSGDDDATLVARAATDRVAFGQLYDRYAEWVYRYCHRWLGDREAAEDATS